MDYYITDVRELQADCRYDLPAVRKFVCIFFLFCLYLYYSTYYNRFH